MKYDQLLRMAKSFGANFPGKKANSPRKRFICNIRRDLSKRALTLSKKDLYAVAYGSVAETKETGLETVELK